jgi:hypothetical protein
MNPIQAEQLTIQLAEKVLEWRLAPGRFIKAGRSWIPRWRFNPLTQIDDAFLLLDRARADFRLTGAGNGLFNAEVCVSRRSGRASGNERARTITIALARALGMQVPEDLTAPKLVQSRSGIDGI